MPFYAYFFWTNLVSITWIGAGWLLGKGGRGQTDQKEDEE